ncbi:MAG: ABC transporter ATP-binding protein [Desulfobulbaceae bacterium]|nr:ABC transporter ATP-binding protein [Desulfobulbaceae bacterium]
MTPMIKLQGVTKKFGGEPVVKQVDLEIEKGSTFALLGPNGVGKTTLVRMMLSFSRPTSGVIMINGVPAMRPEARKSTGYLAEQHLIPPHLSGQEYLRRTAALLGLSRERTSEEMKRVLSLCRMTDKGHVSAAKYSKGMRQRIGLAAAIMGSPELLILDEPVSGLDPVGIKEMRIILENMQRSGTTIMLNSHILSEVEKICDTVAIMDKGQILVKGLLRDIVPENESLEDVFVRYVGIDHE